MYAKDQLNYIITWDMSGKLLNHKLLDFVISAYLAWVSCLPVCPCVCVCARREIIKLWLFWWLQKLCIKKKAHAQQTPNTEHIHKRFLVFGNFIGISIFRFEVFELLIRWISWNCSNGKCCVTNTSVQCLWINYMNEPLLLS